MRRLSTNPNVDNSNPSDYPDGRIKDNTGVDDGTPVNERVYGDIHQNVSKLLRLYGISYTGNPDNETNGYQIVDAIRSLASKNDYILNLTVNAGVLQVPIKLDYMQIDEQVICKSTFDISTQTQIKGLNATVFNITKIGDFKANEYVRLIKTATSIVLIRLFDASNVGDLVTRLQNVENKVANVDDKLAIFQAGGAIIPWGLPLSSIPTGWQEVTDFRGKTIFGMDASQTEFAVLLATGGSKTRTLTGANLPSSVKIPTFDNTGLSPDAGALNCNFDLNTPVGAGTSEPFSILNPYRVVHFIEYIN